MAYPTFEKLNDLRPEGEFPPLELGITPRGRRRIVNVTGGTARGEKLNGTILPGGEDFRAHPHRWPFRDQRADGDQDR